jgi:hypothetical protein
LVAVVLALGFQGPERGDSANKLIPHVGDTDTMIPEFRTFLVRIKKEVYDDTKGDVD